MPSLHQLAIEEFIRRINHVLEELHNAIENKDTDDQHSALAAIVGLVEMLKTELKYGDDEDEEDES